MFKTTTSKSTVYELHQMNDDLLKYIESHEQNADRYNHSESGVSCFLYSIYSLLSDKKGIPPHKKDLTLWKLGFWKDRNSKVNTKVVSKNFLTTHHVDHHIPIIEPISTEEQVKLH
jgi:hypothetical protein